MEEAVERLGNLIGRLDGDVDADVLDNGLVELSRVLVTAGTGHIVESRNEGSNRYMGREVRWYDNECSRAKCAFQESQKHFYEYPSEENRIFMCVKRSEYRKLCRNKKYQYNRDEASRLVELSSKDPKLFWKEIKNNNREKLSTELHFHDHFKKLASRDSKLGDEGIREIEEDREREGVQCY